MQNDKNFRPDRIGAYFHIEWLPLALVTVSGLIYNIGLLATPWFEGQLANAWPIFWTAAPPPRPWPYWC